MMEGLVKKTVMLTFSVIMLLTMVQVSSTYAQTYESHEALLSKFHALAIRFPDIVRPQIIGETHLGKDIWLFKVGNSSGTPILFDALMHGDEDAPAELMYWLLEWLLTSNSTAATTILKKNLILLIPVVNVDSYKRQNCDYQNSTMGVDINRNFHGWISVDPKRSDYGGPYPLSEPETRAVHDVMATYLPVFYLNGHNGYEVPNEVLFKHPRNAYIRDSLFLNNTYRHNAELGITKNYSLGTKQNQGMAICDAHYDFGSNAWIVEVCSWTIYRSLTLSQLREQYFNRLLSIFVSMCEASAGYEVGLIQQPEPPDKMNQTEWEQFWIWLKQQPDLNGTLLQEKQDAWRQNNP
jgi:hypothetical protein